MVPFRMPKTTLNETDAANWEKVNTCNWSKKYNPPSLSLNPYYDMLHREHRLFVDENSNVHP